MAVYWRGGWAYARKTIKGVEYRQSLRTQSKREAAASHDKWVAALHADAAPALNSASFRAAVNKFTDEHLPRLKKSSQIRYLQSLLNLAPHFEGTALKNIRTPELTAFVSARRKTGVKDATIIRDLSCLSSVYTIASDWGLTDANPVLPFLRQMKRRRHLVNGEGRRRHLTHDEELRILKHAAAVAKNPRAVRRHEKAMLAAALAAYIDTGMRRKELLAMKWSWVDLTQNEICIPAAAAKGTRDRRIPILPRLQRLLRALPHNPHTNLVFWRTQHGKGFNDLNHSLQRYAAAVGVRDVCIHDLRRTCGCRLLQDHKLSMKGVSDWLGHASVTTTEQVYAFLNVDNLHQAVGTRSEPENLRRQLDAILSEILPFNGAEDLSVVGPEIAGDVALVAKKNITG